MSPPRSDVRRLLLSYLLGLASALWAQGQNNSPSPNDISDSALRIRGIFDSSLPGTEKRDVLRFIFHPHLGDLTKRDHLRVPIGLRYGATRHLELTGEANAYVSHGMGDVGFGHDRGFSELHFGAKYNLGTPFRPGWETAVGLDHILPVGHPPVDLTDGMKHTTPFIAFSHRLFSAPQWRVFWGASVDLVDSSHVRGQLQDNDLGDDATGVNAGFVWDRGRIHYTLEGSYATTRWIGDTQRDIFTLRPGFVWELPPRWSPTEGRWLIGAGLRTTFGEDGTDFGASAKVRVDFNLKRWWKSLRSRSPPPTPVP